MLITQDKIQVLDEYDELISQIILIWTSFFKLNYL